MTEMAFPLDELEDFQELRRRGPGTAFWDHNKLRRPARVVLNGIEDKPKISVILRRLRDNINAGRSLMVEPEEPTLDIDLMATMLPPKETLRSLGASACESPIEQSVSRLQKHP